VILFGGSGALAYEGRMTRSPLPLIVDQFKREPSRTGSLIITLYGDAILPRGGSVWLGTLLAFLELLDIDGGVVRTAMSRLAADGWLERERNGRKSYYKLAASGRARFDSGIQHVYHPHVTDWEGRLELLLIGHGADREASRAMLVEAGFGSPMPGVWVAPAGTAVPAVAGDAVRLDVSASNDMGRRLIGEAWPLSDISSAYSAFLNTFTPLHAWLAGRARLSPADAILARVLLIHQYRRVLLRDPLLPAALLPADWPAAAARTLCGRIYQALLPQSEQWLDAFGESASGKLPAPDTMLSHRFTDI